MGIMNNILKSSSNPYATSDVGEVCDSDGRRRISAATGDI